MQVPTLVCNFEHEWFQQQGIVFTVRRARNRARTLSAPEPMYPETSETRNEGTDDQQHADEDERAAAIEPYVHPDRLMRTGMLARTDANDNATDGGQRHANTGAISLGRCHGG